MGLHGDFKELGLGWRGSSWQIKTWLVISGILASSAIASLSETVAKWKGFILTGIQYYQEVLRQPLVNWAAAIAGIQPPVEYIDYVVILLLLSLALFRKALFTIKFSHSKLDRRIDFAGMAVLSFALFASIATPLLAPNWLASKNTTDYRETAIISYALVAGLALVPPRNASHLILFVHLIAPLTLVCFLAAINAGLK